MIFPFLQSVEVSDLVSFCTAQDDSSGLSSEPPSYTTAGRTPVPFAPLLSAARTSAVSERVSAILLPEQPWPLQPTPDSQDMGPGVSPDPRTVHPQATPHQAPGSHPPPNKS